MISRISFITLIILLLFTRCQKDKSFLPSQDKNLLYFNSFENSEDLADILHSSSYMLTSETPENAGDSSVVISGGCTGPFHQIVIDPIEEEISISLDVWAQKIGQLDGGINVSTESNPKDGISISIQDANWTHYTTKEVLLVPANEKIIIRFEAGGFAGITINCDLLSLKRID